MLPVPSGVPALAVHWLLVVPSGLTAKASPPCRTAAWASAPTLRRPSSLCSTEPPIPAYPEPASTRSSLPSPVRTSLAAPERLERAFLRTHCLTLPAPPSDSTRFLDSPLNHLRPHRSLPRTSIAIAAKPARTSPILSPPLTV